MEISEQILPMFSTEYLFKNGFQLLPESKGIMMVTVENLQKYLKSIYDKIKEMEVNGTQRQNK